MGERLVQPFVRRLPVRVFVGLRIAVERDHRHLDIVQEMMRQKHADAEEMLHFCSSASLTRSACAGTAASPCGAAVFSKSTISSMIAVQAIAPKMQKEAISASTTRAQINSFISNPSS